MYAAYNTLFFDTMKDGLKIEKAFDNLTNTGFWEQYMLNAFQFSAAKNRAEMKLIQEKVFDTDKKVKGFSEFKNDPAVADIMDKFNGPDWWLRTEYDLATNGAVMAEKWQRDYKDKDLMPYWMYVCADAPCDICEPLDGMVFSYDDEEAQGLFPPNHFNCLCTSEPTESDENLTPGNDIESGLEGVPEQFRGNVGTDGIFPREGSSYFDVLPSANNADYEMFGALQSQKASLNTTWYKDHSVTLMLESWDNKTIRHKDHTDVVFRNHQWLLNVRASTDKIRQIAKRSRGVENIKRTIEHPDEIWGRWEDPNKQKTAIINYLAHDEKYTYIVETKGGIVQNAFYRLHEDSKKLRMKGVKFLK